jgi:hypothetical protein
VLYHFEHIESLLDKDGVFSNWQRKADFNTHTRAIDDLVFDIYDLHPVERQLVADTLQYGIEFFNWAKRKTRRPRAVAAVKRPDVSMLEAYAKVFVQAATSFLRVRDQTLVATIYKNGAPLTVLSFDLVTLDDARPVRVVTQTGAMREKLRELNDLALRENTPSFYTRRHVRIYDGNQVSIIRPSERRFWSESRARVDADAFLAELLE